MFTKCLDFTTLPLLSNVSAPRKARNAAGANFLLCCHKEPKGVEGVSVPEHLNPLFLPQISVNQSTQPNLFTCEARNTSLPSLRATRFFPEWPLYQILGYTLFSHSVGMYVTLKRAALGKANGRINKINDIDQGWIYKSETNGRKGIAIEIKGEITAVQLLSKREDYQLHAQLSDETRHRKPQSAFRNAPLSDEMSLSQ